MKTSSPFQPRLEDDLRSAGRKEEGCFGGPREGRLARSLPTRGRGKTAQWIREKRTPSLSAEGKKAG